MAIQANLSQFFTPQSVSQLLKDSEPVRTPIWSRVFGNVKQHPLAHISVRTITDVTGNVPLIKRGTPSIGVDGAEESSNLFEPQPIAVNTVLKAKDFIDLMHINSVSSQEAWVAEKLANLRDRIYNTTEALCCQAISGQINYAIKIYEGDLGNYKVNFGPLIPASAYVGFTGGWGTADLEGIFRDLLILESAIKLKTRYGARIGILAGTTAFYTLIGKANTNNTSSNIDIKIERHKLYLNGYEIEYMGDAEYTDLHTGTRVKAIGDNEIYMFAEDAPFQLNYLALDDFDVAGNPSMVARAFYPKEIMSHDPSAKKIVVQSKPFPQPVTLASLKVDVIS